MTSPGQSPGPLWLASFVLGSGARVPLGRTIELTGIPGARDGVSANVRLQSNHIALQGLNVPLPASLSMLVELHAPDVHSAADDAFAVAARLQPVISFTANVDAGEPLRLMVIEAGAALTSREFVQ